MNRITRLNRAMPRRRSIFLTTPSEQPGHGDRQRTHGRRDAQPSVPRGVPRVPISASAARAGLDRDGRSRPALTGVACGARGRRQRTLAAAALLALLGGLAACGAPAAPPAAAAAHAAPARIDNRVTEQELTRVTLSAEAERRLGIEIAEVRAQAGSRTIDVGGEVLAVPGQATIAVAPASGTVRLAGAAVTPGRTVRKGEALLRLTPLLGAQRDLRVTLESEAQAAKARLDTATQQRDRARQLLRDLAGSQRNVEAAEQEFGQAKALHDAAVARLERLGTQPLDADIDLVVSSPVTGVVRQLQVAPGQAVTAGAPLFDVADISRVWIRVPLYAAELRDARPGAAAQVRDIDGQGVLRDAKPVVAPPSADPLAMTSDLYFELPNRDGALRPGQRVSVRLPMQERGSDSTTDPARGASRAAPASADATKAAAVNAAAPGAATAAAGDTRHERLVVPISAVVYDAQGGAWVYVQDAPRLFRRQRVDVVETAGASIVLARGVTAGTRVVSTGVAELFGTEFGAGH